MKARNLNVFWLVLVQQLYWLSLCKGRPFVRTKIDLEKYRPETIVYQESTRKLPQQKVTSYLGKQRYDNSLPVRQNAGAIHTVEGNRLEMGQGADGDKIESAPILIEEGAGKYQPINDRETYESNWDEHVIRDPEGGFHRPIDLFKYKEMLLKVSKELEYLKRLKEKLAQKIAEHNENIKNQENF